MTQKNPVFPPTLQALIFLASTVMFLYHFFFFLDKHCLPTHMYLPHIFLKNVTGNTGTFFGPIRSTCMPVSSSHHTWSLYCRLLMLPRLIYKIHSDEFSVQFHLVFYSVFFFFFNRYSQYAMVFVLFKNFLLFSFHLSKFFNFILHLIALISSLVFTLNYFDILHLQ